MKKILLLTILALAMLVTACGGTTTPSTGAVTTTATEAEAVQPFRVGMEAGYAPFNWSQIDDSNGAVKIDGSSEYAGGYDVEIAKIIADALGRPLVIVKTEWDGLGISAVSGKIDAIIAGMSPTADRKETLDFTDNYYESEFIIVVRRDGPYADATSLADFAGAKISAQLNTNHYPAIDQIPGVVKEDAMDSFSTLRMSLMSGKIDGYVSERPDGRSVEAALSELKMIQFSAENGFQVDPEDVVVGVAVNKNNPLRDEINTILQTISLEQREEIMAQAIANQPVTED